MENLKVLFSVPQMESASNSADVLVDGVAEDVNAEEIHQTEAGCDELLLVEAESDINGREIFLSVNKEPEMDVNHNLDDDAVNADESSKAMVNDKSVNGDLLQKGIDPAPKNEPPVKANKTSLERWQHPSLKDSRNQKAKFVRDNKSGEKESMRMKAGESQPSSLKAETRRYQPLHRLSCTVNSTKVDTSSSAAVFSFKSNERAERRKEFYTELQQKMHAKEAEMNQMQVRRQEKTEAEIKQFRRSLNFKATPMPSFYHVAVPPGSDGKKALSSNNKINKARDKSTNPGSRAADRSKSCLKEGSDQASSTNESVNTTERTDALEKTNCPTGEHSGGSASSQTLPTNQSCFLEVGVENKVVRRKEREKERDTSMYKHCVSEIHKVMKGQRAEGKQKVGAQRSSNEMARKEMKSSSGLGNLVVGVAS
ncbi:hypothetical protein F2P56_034976 [Juglans regia]|uniref:TPX2 C-terminal domain-containing protein n=1 Tax=Juglans regia TaxID=51240 RepID=A0A833U0T4_JUGRE|nr:hypothetical protein F2P56_034976 [Juglans regia]